MLAWDNCVLSKGARTAVLYASSAAATLPISNLQDMTGSPSMAWQSAYGTTQYGTGIGAWFGLGLGSGQPIGALALARTNLTATATVRWLLDYGTPSSPTIVSLQWDSGDVANTVIPGFGQSVIIPPAGITCATVHCYINDQYNPDGFINVPLAFIGAAWQPLTNLSINTTHGRDDQTAEVVTRGGQEYPLLYWQRRRWDLDFQGIRTSEIWPYVDDLDRTARLGGNVLLVPNPASSNIGREAVLGRLKARADLGYFQGAQDRRTWKATITERL